MADQQNTDFNFYFTPFATYEAYSGEGGSDNVPFAGLVHVNLTSLSAFHTAPKDGSQPKPAVKVGSVIQDEDGKGLRLISTVLAGGKDKNGDDLGRQFIDLLVSSGTTVDAIKKNAQNNVGGPISGILNQLRGRGAYCEIDGDTYDGRETTRVLNWVTKERYEQAKAIGAHRRPRRKVGAAGATPGLPAGAVVGTANGMAGAGASAGALPML